MADQVAASERDAKILAAHAAFVNRLSSARSEICWNAYDNALMYLGHQWRVFDPARRAFRRPYLKKTTPTPVTNKIFPIVNSIHAGLCRVDPMLAFRPGSTKDRDRVTAELAGEVLDYLKRATHAADLDLRLSKAVCLYSNAYKVSGYDPEGGPLDWVAHWTCPDHPDVALPPDEARAQGGVCPADGQPLVEDPVRGQAVAQGSVYAELGTVFEVWLDPTIPLVRDQPKALFRRMRATEWAHARWPEHRDVLLPEAAPQDIGMTCLQSILRLTPGGRGSMGFSGTARFDGAVMIDDFFVLPDKDFPQGCLARIGNGRVVLEAVEPYPYHEGLPERPGRMFLPIAHYYADDIVPAHIATGPIDHLKEPQCRRNRLQARMEMHEARMANGVWAIPEGADVATPSGESGQVIRFNPMATGGAAPRRIDGARIPSTTLAQIPQIDAEMQDIAGTYEIGTGDRPKNVEGGYAMQILQNAAKGRQAPLYRRWEQSHAEAARHQFHLFRLFAPPEIYYQVQGEESRWRVKLIQRAELYGGITIDVEPGSGLPQSLLEKRAGVEQAISMGLVDVANPIERLKCLRAMGVPELMSGRQAEDDHIAREHDTVVEYARTNFHEDGRPKVMPLPPFPVLIDPELEPHDFHLDRHHAWMISDEFRALPPDVQRLFRDAHALQHLLQMQMQQQAAAAAAAPAPPARRGGAAQQSEADARKSERGQGSTGREQRRQTDGESAAA